MMVMMVEAHGGLQIRLELVWCPRFACGLAFTFSLHTGPPSTSLIFTFIRLRKLFSVLFEKIQNTENCLLYCLRKYKIQKTDGYFPMCRHNV